MSLRPHLLRTLFSFLLALSAGLAPAQSAFAEPQPLDRIIVVVNDGTVLQSELEQAMDDARAQIAKRQLAAPPEDVLRAQVLERLILTRVQTQRAEQAGIRIDDRELNEVQRSEERRVGKEGDK